MPQPTDEAPQDFSRRPGATLYRYIGREVLLPTLFALGGFTLVVLTKDLTGYTELVVNRGAGLTRILAIVGYQAIPLASQMMPFAVLVGGLVALGRLGADLEILVLEALGMSPGRLIPPLAIFGALMAIVGLSLSLVAVPWAQRSLDHALEDLARVNPAAQIRAGVVNRFGGWKLEAREVSSRGNELRTVMLWTPELGETVFAERGLIESDDDATLTMTLFNGAVLLDAREHPRHVRFEKMETTLPTNEDPIARSGADAIAGLPLAALFEIGGDEGDARRVPALLEAHGRFALPLAAAIFGALAVPLFFARASSSRSSGGVLGVAATIVYYGLVQLGQGIVQGNASLAPFGAWLPNLAMSAITLVLFARLARQSGFARDSDRRRSREPGKRLRGASSELRVRRFALQRYVAFRFVEMALLCFGALVVAYLLVDVLERLQWFTRNGATPGEVLRFYGARLPLLVSRVVPMGLLVAMALTVSLLASQGELIGMRSCGIAAPRALFPALIVCVLAMPLSFLLNDQIVPRTNALADLIKNRDIRGRGSSVRTAVWYASGNLVYQLDSLDTSLGAARKIVIYELDQRGLPTSRIDAESASNLGGDEWRLENPIRIELKDDGQMTRLAAGPYAKLGGKVSQQVDTMHLSVSEVADLIEEFNQTGHSTTQFMVDLYVKLATPLACLLLPAMALLFAASGPPFPGSAMTLVLSAVVAVSYTLLTGTLASFGYSEALPPWLAGWGPTLLVGTIVVVLAARMRGFGYGD